MKTELYSHYDPFAFTYNRHWGDCWSSFLPFLEPLILNKLQAGDRILDVCCGTGQLAAQLIKRGFTVTGIDSSAAQLSHARENAPDAEFIHADARCFTMTEEFQGVLSTYDSLNHIDSIKGLGQAFTCIRKVMAPGGIFLFDMNMEEAYLKRWRSAKFHMVEDDHVCMVRTDYDPDKFIADFKATTFVLEQGQWKRYDTDMHQYCYARADIEHQLSEAGFTTIQAYQYTSKAGIEPLQGEWDRAIFVVQK